MTGAIGPDLRFDRESRMNFDDLARLIFELPPDQTVLLLGKPGIGKTALGRRVATHMTEARRRAEPGAPEALCHVVDLSSSLPEDISGLPFPQGDMTDYKPTAWVHELCRPGAYGVLVLDDLPAATQAVQVACRQIALERRVHRHAFSPGVRVLVTGNRREDRSAASTLPAHFRNSCLMLEVEPDVDGWCRWAHAQELPAEIPAFIRFRNGRLAMLPKDADEQGAFATPRTWAMLGRCLPAARARGALYDVAAGLVGRGVATEFVGFCRLREELPDPRALLEDPIGRLPAPPAEPDKQIALVTALAETTVSLARRARGKERDAVLGRFLKALAHVTRKNREFCGAAVATFVGLGGDMQALAAAAGALKDDPGVGELLRSIRAAVAA